MEGLEQNLEMMRHPGQWPLRSLPVKRVAGWGFDSGYLEAKAGGGAEPIVRLSDGGTKRYSSFESLFEDGWRVD